MKETGNKSELGASLVSVMSVIIIGIVLVLLIVPQLFKQEDTQSETVVLGYERTARKAAREAFTIGMDSLDETFDREGIVEFVIDSKGKKIYLLKENESLAEFSMRLKKDGVKPMENYGEKLTLTVSDPWETRVVKSNVLQNSYFAGEKMVKGKTYDLRNYMIVVAVKEEDNKYQYYQWWQNVDNTGLLED